MAIGKRKRKKKKKEEEVEVRRSKTKVSGFSLVYLSTRKIYAVFVCSQLALTHKKQKQIVDREAAPLFQGISFYSSSPLAVFNPRR